MSESMSSPEIIPWLFKSFKLILCSWKVWLIFTYMTYVNFPEITFLFTFHSCQTQRIASKKIKQIPFSVCNLKTFPSLPFSSLVMFHACNGCWFIKLKTTQNKTFYPKKNWKEEKIFASLISTTFFWVIPSKIKRKS